MSGMKTFSLTRTFGLLRTYANRTWAGFTGVVVVPGGLARNPTVATVTTVSRTATVSTLARTATMAATRRTVTIQAS